VTRRPRIDDLTSFAAPEEPALSPDGSLIAYVLRTADATADRAVTCLWRVSVTGGEPEQLTHGPADTAPAWSPDGTGLAFLRDDGESEQIWLLPAGGGEARKLTSLAPGAGAPVWSPAGDRIAFTAPAQAKEPNKPVVADRLGIREAAHVHVLDLDTGACRQITDGDWPTGDPAWSPDGTRLAYPERTGPDGDLSLSEPVWVIDADGKGEPRRYGPTGGVATTVIWDDDVLLATERPAGPGGHQHLMRIPLDGGPVIDLAAALDRNVSPFRAQVAEGRVYFLAVDRGCFHLFAAGRDSGDAGLVVGGAGRNVIGFSVRGGTVAVALETATSLGEIHVVDLATGEERVRTAHNDPEIEFYPRREREFVVSDGAVVHGWVIRDDDAVGPQPLLLDVHGGPHNAWSGAADGIHMYHQELVRHGWTVLLLNPRGSDGYGEAFYAAVSGAWGEADAGDLLEPIDVLVAEGIADPHRLAVTGYSYGGFMTCYLTSRDGRFAAAVAGAPISDLTSMTGTADIAQYLGVHEIKVLPWQDRERAAELSPLSRVEQVAAPTLVLAGADDRRCPPDQARQWHTALRQRGVPARLVMYPEADHLFVFNGRPSYRIDYHRRTVAWLREHTVGRPATLDAARWERRLHVLAERYGVPGATLGILQLDGDTVEVAHGVLSTRTQVATTPGSVFQIGSISKIWTTTLVMQLVDEGKLSLDAPLTDVLPELKLPDAAVTMRHLLTHTSGIDGDVFTDTGRGDDCVERYVELLADVAQTHPLGATWSYCNAGFVLAGRVIERLTGLTWDAAVQKRIGEPLGLTRTGTMPEEALLHRAAVGHLSTGEELIPTPVWMLPRGVGPAGLIHSSAGDVLAFARMHLAGGVAPDGTRVLAGKAVTAMTEHQADVPDGHTQHDSWGLGWMRATWDGRLVIGHDGRTVGQCAYLRMIPELGVAAVLLTNSDEAADLADELLREVFAEVAGVAMPRPPSPPEHPVEADITPHVGVYRRSGAEIEVLADGVLRYTTTGELAALTAQPVTEYRLVPVADDHFLMRSPTSGVWTPVRFYTLPGGERYVHLSVRATPKVDLA
jgi:dipeptidyl aminopeptidase/acylaminoacyl peptidase/CubicO group peptidase (beta-lactamase class C family)